jgi:putative ABC transport system ATP-binding protein
MFGLHLKRNGSKTSPGHQGDGPGYLVDLRRVVKTYASAAGSFTALKGIDLQVGAGGFVSIIGKSGSGKSTLINMITGIDRPTAGEVLVDNTAVHQLSEEQIAVWRGHTIGVIFQFFQLLPTLTAVENVMLAMDYGRRYPPAERAERAMSL